MFSITAPLIVQGENTITILPNQIPLIRFMGTFDEEHVERQVALGINFLRAGCPKIQILLPYPESRANICLDKILGLFNLLELPGERWRFEREDKRICLVTRLSAVP